jgi:hypothetical protein
VVVFWPYSIAGHININNHTLLMSMGIGYHSFSRWAWWVLVEVQAD